MRIEKSPVQSKESTGGFTALLLLVLIGVSIACSTSKSASPETQLTSNQPISSPAPQQQPSSSPIEKTACSLTLAEGPTVFGLKLGMTSDEVLALFPGSKEDAEVSTSIAKRGPYGNATFAITPQKYGSAANFKGVSRLSLSLLDGRISKFTVSYNGPEWPNVDKFIDNFVGGKNLPQADQWDPYVGMDNQMKTLTCTGFSVRIFSGGEGGSQNYVLVDDVAADKKLKDRRKKAQEQATPSPAP